MAAQPFSDPASVAQYAENARGMVPGLPFVHELTAALLAEVVPERWARFTAAPGTDEERIEATVATMAARLPILTPEEDEATLSDAGFRDVGVFYGALTFWGWVASA